ncbi:MAG TPA: enolase C-terminal domain-like protein [Acidimicrobiales bacterium]|nr:enolase C-terminal domain-like protein [Acidimicrobiales bacterium]
MSRPEVTVDHVEARTYVVPTDQPEADGTLAWDSTTVVVVLVTGGGHTGLGWSYAGGGAADTVEEKLSSVVCGSDALTPRATHEAMVRAVRNVGRPGLASCAISAVDIALWDLAARLHNMPVADLLGRCRSEVPVYGSGGFTTYDDETTAAQLRRWVDELGIPRVKIKVGESWGTRSHRDLHRVALTRGVVGEDVDVFVDANGAYSRKQAVRLGQRMAEGYGVTWFEEPVSSDDLDGLREVRAAVSADVAAGEYGWSPTLIAPLVGAVDCLQVDVTRVGGFTDWLAVAALAAAAGLDVSGHCAPALHAHVALAAPRCRHVELFHDHERIESMLFRGAPPVVDGAARPHLDRPGLGMALADDSERWRRW